MRWRRWCNREPEGGSDRPYGPVPRGGRSLTRKTLGMSPADHPCSSPGVRASRRLMIVFSEDAARPAALPVVGRPPRSRRPPPRRPPAALASLWASLPPRAGQVRHEGPRRRASPPLAGERAPGARFRRPAPSCFHHVPTGSLSSTMPRRLTMTMTTPMVWVVFMSCRPEVGTGGDYDAPGAGPEALPSALHQLHRDHQPAARHRSPPLSVGRTRRRLHRRPASAERRPSTPASGGRRPREQEGLWMWAVDNALCRALVPEEGLATLTGRWLDGVSPHPNAAEASIRPGNVPVGTSCSHSAPLADRAQGCSRVRSVSTNMVGAGQWPPAAVSALPIENAGPMSSPKAK